MLFRSRHGHRLLGHEAVVTGVLLLRLLTGAGDHKGALGQGALLSGDPCRNRVVLLDLLMGEAAGQQAAQLLASERMACEHQRNAQPLRHQSTHVTGIGVVGVDPVGPARLGGQTLRERIGQRIEAISAAAKNLRGKFAGAVGAYNALSLLSKTPAEVVAALNKEINAALLDATIKQRLADLGALIVPPNTPAEFAKFIADDTAKWSKVIKAAGIKPQ